MRPPPRSAISPSKTTDPRAVVDPTGQFYRNRQRSFSSTQPHIARGVLREHGALIVDALRFPAWAQRDRGRPPLRLLVPSGHLVAVTASGRDAATRPAPGAVADRSPRRQPEGRRRSATYADLRHGRRLLLSRREAAAARFRIRVKASAGRAGGSSPDARRSPNPGRSRRRTESPVCVGAALRRSGPESVSVENMLRIARADGILDEVVTAIDPLNIDIGRLRRRVRGVYRVAMRLETRACTWSLTGRSPTRSLRTAGSTRSWALAWRAWSMSRSRPATSLERTRSWISGQ